MAPIAHLLNSQETETEDLSPLGPQSYGSPASDDETLTTKSSSFAPSCRSHSEANSTRNSSDEEAPIMQKCRWKGCSMEFSSAELLYHHLCQDHVGRKSQKNLQLNCQWGDCKIKTVKRDHITSHLRVHVPLKPFACSTCNKKFKRPQDLKKHLKVHDEELLAYRKKRGPKTSQKVSKLSSNKNFDHARPTLPSISLDRFINEYANNQTPVYSTELAEKLRTVLPLPGGVTPSFSMSLPPSSPSLLAAPSYVRSDSIGSASDMRSAIGFFNNLAYDMSRTYGYNPHSQTLGPSGAGSPSSAHPYPFIPKLPPINSRPNVSAHSLPIFDRFETAPAPPSSISSSFYPQNYAHAYSLNQKTARSKNLDGSITSLESRLNELNLDENVDDNLFFETYAFVNLAKDYLLCELFETLDEFDDPLTEQVSILNKGSQLGNMLPKYTPVII